MITVELKDAVDLVNAETELLGIAAGMNNKEAARVISAYNLYLIDKDAYRSRELIQAVYNWLASTGRGDGEE